MRRVVTVALGIALIFSLGTAASPVPTGAPVASDSTINLEPGDFAMLAFDVTHDGFFTINSISVVSKDGALDSQMDIQCFCRGTLCSCSASFTAGSQPGTWVVEFTAQDFETGLVSNVGTVTIIVGGGEARTPERILDEIDFVVRKSVEGETLRRGVANSLSQKTRVVRSSLARDSLASASSIALALYLELRSLNESQILTIVKEFLLTLAGQLRMALPESTRTMPQVGWDTGQFPTSIGSCQVERQPNSDEVRVHVYSNGRDGYGLGSTSSREILPRVDSDTVPCDPEDDVQIRVYAAPVDIRSSATLEYGNIQVGNVTLGRPEFRDIHGFGLVVEIEPEGQCHVEQIILEDRVTHRRGGAIITDSAMRPDPQNPQQVGPMMDVAAQIQFNTPGQIQQFVLSYRANPKTSQNPSGVDAMGFDGIRMPGVALAFFDVPAVVVGVIAGRQSNDIIDRSMRLRTYLFCTCDGQAAPPVAAIDWEFTQQITVSTSNRPSTSSITAQSVNIVRRGQGGLQRPAPNQASPYEQDLNAAQANGPFDPTVNYLAP